MHDSLIFDGLAHRNEEFIKHASKFDCSGHVSSYPSSSSQTSKILICDWLVRIMKVILLGSHCSE